MEISSRAVANVMTYNLDYGSFFFFFLYYYKYFTGVFLFSDSLIYYHDHVESVFFFMVPKYALPGY